MLGVSVHDDLRRRLAELGLRRGATVTCLRGTIGGGRVLDVAGTRIALGRQVLRAIECEAVAVAENDPAGDQPEDVTDGREPE